MKKGWPWKPLGEVCKTGSGGTPLSSRKEYHEGGNIPWLLSGEVAQGNVREAKNFITKAGLENSAAKLFPKDTVLVAMYGATAGQVGILRFDAATNQAVCGILPNDRFIPEFLFYFLLAKKDELVAQATGNAQPNISQIKIKNTEVPVPPLAEQQRIVGLLDEAFEGLATAKANAEKNLQNARALFESHLQSVFTQAPLSEAEGRGPGWVEKRLDAIAEFSQGIQVGLGDQSTAPARGLVRFIRIIDYTQGTDDIRYVQDPGRRYWADKSDIVMVRYGTPGLVGRGIEGVIANNLFKISILGGSLLKDFLAYFLGQQTVQNYLSSQGSSTMPALTFTQLGAVVVSFPQELEKQNAIVSKLDDLREETQRLARLYERKHAALEALKKSLLHQAFTGEL